MHNITVVIGDDCYRRARVWAAQHDTSLSAVVRHLLETLLGLQRANKAFPISNLNPSVSRPTPSEPSKSPTAISSGETVDRTLTPSIPDTSANPTHEAAQIVKP